MNLAVPPDRPSNESFSIYWILNIYIFLKNIYNLKFLVLEVCIKTHNPLNQTLTFEGLLVH